jgi:hypothetical protein
MRYGDLSHTILQPINSDGMSVSKQCRTVPAKRIVGGEGRMRIGVRDADEIVFSVVGVDRDIVRRVGNAGQPVLVVIGVRGRLAVLVGN